MKILLSIGARAEDSRSMRMTDMGTSMVAGLGKSASPEGSECMTLVVNDGKILEQGTHDELLANKNLYANLVMAQ